MIRTLTLGAPARDGEVVLARLRLPETPARLTLIAGAFAVRQHYYERFATWLTHRGHAVLTVDYRGIGESRPERLRGQEARATDWIADLDAAVTAARQHLPELPLTVLGHSFGGQVLPLLEHAPHIRRVATIGTQFAHPRYWTGTERLRMALIFGAVIPLVSRTWGYLPGWTGIGEHTPGPVARDWARWCRSRSYLLDHVPGAPEAFARFDVPVQAWAVSDDAYAPLPGVQAYAAALPNARVQCLQPSELGLDQLGHFGPFRPPAHALWERLADSLEQPPGPAPSAAPVDQSRISTD